MNISLNGESFEFHGQTVAELIAAQMPPAPFAVAVNTGFVPRGRYDAHALAEGDKVVLGCYRLAKKLFKFN